MKMTMKHGALALALLCSAALFAGPAVANSLHDEGDFGGAYNIGPSGGPERWDYQRKHTFRRYYYGPAYGYYDYDYGPAYNYGPPIVLGPGVDVELGY